MPDGTAAAYPDDAALVTQRHNRTLCRIARGNLSNDADADEAVPDGYV